MRTEIDKTFSFFELIFIIAIKYFIKKNVDYIILETGLGGKYDVTNIFDKPFITILTSIHKEHTNILGETLAEIAENKAAIIKKDVPCFVMYPQDDEVIEIFKSKTSENCFYYKNYFELLQEQLTDEQRTQSGLKNLNIIYQITEYLDIDFPFSTSSELFTIPGRMEKIQNNPDVILDAAHNPDKIKFLCKNLNKLYPDKKIHFFLSIINSKDYLNILDIISEIAESISICKVNDYFREAIDPDIIKEYCKNKHDIDKSYTYTDAKTGYFDLLNKTTDDEIIVVTGSFLIVGMIRDIYYPEYYIMEKRYL